MKFDSETQEYLDRKEAALAMGGPVKLSQRARDGVLNARQRIAELFDPGTFRETGLFGTSSVPEMRASTPTDGKVCGFGKVDGRESGVVAYDFTIKGASSSPVSNKKMQHIKDVSAAQGFPTVYLGESTGVRMPDIMGGAGMAGMSDKVRFLRTRETPWVSAVFGYTFGSAAWHACCSDFNVMRKGAIMAVSSPTLVAMATGQHVDPEDLGGWKLHSETTGFADYVAESDEEAVTALRRYLSYLPSNNQEAPPTTPQVEAPPNGEENILSALPEAPNRVYDVRKIIQSVVDKDSLFELKERYARNLVTGLARIEGRVVGLVANNPQFKAGAVDADACDKATSFIVLCDSFNIPLVSFVDQPGFLVGLEAERKKIAGKVINWMNALSLCTVPKICLILRKSYGQAFVNMGAAGMSDEVAIWWSADISFMDPKSGVRIVHGITREDDPNQFDQHLSDMARANSAYDFAAAFGAQEVIDPRESRAYLARTLDIYRLRATNGLGEHRLHNWPTSF